MKKYLLCLVSVAVLFTACKEKGPYINLTPSGPTGPSADTTYVTTIDTAHQESVLVEEFTGASCTNCPAAHAALDAISDANPGQVNILGVHLFNFPQSNPVAGSVHDFRTQEGTDIGNTIYGGVSFMPSAGIDRVPVGSDLLLSSGAWSGDIATRLTTARPLNMYIQSTYNAADTTATITVTVAYTQSVTGTQNLAVAITEDSLIDKQEDGFAIDTAYVFTNVFRDFVSAETFGDPFLDTLATKEPGRVYRRTYTYHLQDASWVPSRCHVVAFVCNNTATSKEILQSAKAKMAQ